MLFFSLINVVERNPAHSTSKKKKKKKKTSTDHQLKRKSLPNVLENAIFLTKNEITRYNWDRITL